MKYPCDINYVKEGDDFYWVVKSKVLEHCVSQGDTPEEALMIFEELEQAWLDACKEDNLDIPMLLPTICINRFDDLDKAENLARMIGVMNFFNYSRGEKFESPSKKT